MKKVLSLILVALMVMMIVPMATVSVSAAEKVVFLKDEATGDGSSADKPLGTWADAYAALGNEGGTIVLIDEFVWIEEFDAPTHTGKITITGKYNGVDYKGSIFISGTVLHFMLGGPTEFNNMGLSMIQDMMIRCRWNPVTMGEGLTVDPGSSGIFICGGNQAGKYDEMPENTDTHIVIKSGQYAEILGGLRGANHPGSTTGKCCIEITGDDVTVKKIALCSRDNQTDESQNLGSGLLILDGGLITHFCCAHTNKGTNGCTGDVTMVITKNFKFADSFKGFGERYQSGAFQGFSGTSVYQDCETLALKANTNLLIDPALYDEIMASDCVAKDTFTKIEKYTYNNAAFGSGSLEAGSAPTTDVPTTTAAPTTDAPTTTVAPTTTAGGEVTPTTGDASLAIVIAMAAVLCTAAVVVIKKKEN